MLKQLVQSSHNWVIDRNKFKMSSVKVYRPVPLAIPCALANVGRKHGLHLNFAWVNSVKQMIIQENWAGNNIITNSITVYLLYKLLPISNEYLLESVLNKNIGLDSGLINS